MIISCLANCFQGKVLRFDVNEEFITPHWCKFTTCLSVSLLERPACISVSQGTPAVTVHVIRYILTVTSSWMTCMIFFCKPKSLTKVLSQDKNVPLATFTLQGFASHVKGLLSASIVNMSVLWNRTHAHFDICFLITTTHFHSHAITHWLQIEKKVAFFVTIWYVISLWRIAG